ncbi:cytochrome b/b6 domain-containing protein [Devosia sp. FJ2-5-3]|jgi:cytochrome b561|uniref:cytochrome b n=1 Tax=Devosia sp. FJ2-5-3 TaxID=2976680 RepID=UPI0023D7D213|nr:cytochrome b/b6 domain-containing protein [Devosia sp. FJ2-5-3]WEJ59365.1 cytochrome b/b6 domain-containing protein [Devosia sp. FJ2-5-3]
MAEVKGYSTVQIILHWAIAALVVFQLFVNEAMQIAFNERLDGEIGGQTLGALLHIIVGMTVLVLAAIRVFFRLRRGAPPPHSANPAILNWLGAITHFLLYGFIFFMPLTGAIAWFLGIELAAELHEIGRLVLIPAIAFHVVGALVEHFVLRRDSLTRMLKATADG